MSQFEVKVYELEILPHPNADKIELAKVGDYLSVVGKGEFKTGDWGAYIPEQSVLPNEVIEALGLKGKLSGGAKNRVRAAKLRGVLSQGVIFPCRPSWKLGDNVADELGIKKHEPQVPASMRGKAVGVDQNITINYDIENVKKYPHLFLEMGEIAPNMPVGDLVVMTEKIHGTFVQFGYIPKGIADPSKLYMGAFTVTSKGLGGRGILLDYYDQNNVYTQIAAKKEYDIWTKLVCIRAEFKDVIGDNPVYICGEIFGPGVQTGFGYGVPNGEIQFRAFDLAWGQRSDLKYMSFPIMKKIFDIYSIPIVPVLYEGLFSKGKLLEITPGKEQVSGKELHMREGVVVKPYWERYDSRAGRVILKSVSEEYLLRKGEVTEYQ